MKTKACKAKSHKPDKMASTKSVQTDKTVTRTHHKKTKTKKVTQPEAERKSGPLKTPKWEKFAQAVAAGASASEAYRSIGGKGSKNADVHSARLMVNDSIQQRITELQQSAAEKVEFSLIDAMNLIKEIIETPIGLVDKMHKLCQEYSETTGEMSSSVRFKMPDKLAALEKMIKIKGWYAPEKQEITTPENKPIICMLPPIITTPRPTRRKGANLPPQKTASKQTNGSDRFQQ